MNDSLEQLKKDILAALAHPEAEEGLYLENLCVVHQEEERLPVRGNPDEVLIALQLLMEEGKVLARDNGEKVAFSLVK
ncbi:MAG: hypothetical protein KDD64_09425 [Bdellovibrionales bacterium]|nr:hypothetical protein [Bdellovibrionales bacterium]